MEVQNAALTADLARLHRNAREEKLELESQHRATLEDLRTQHAIAAQTYETQLRGAACATSAAVQSAQVRSAAYLGGYRRTVVKWLLHLDCSHAPPDRQVSAQHAGVGGC